MLARCLLKVIEVERGQLARGDQIFRPSIWSSRLLPTGARFFESVNRHLNVIPIRGIRVSYGQDVAIPVKRLSDRRITSHHSHASVQRAFACAISLLDDPPDDEERKQAGDCEPDNLQNSKPPCRKCCRRFRRRYGNQIAAAMPADDGGLLNIFCAELAFLHEGAATSYLVPLAWNRATRLEFANRIHP